MRKSKFTDAQISFILKQADEGTSVAEVCRKAGIAEATFYNWRKKYAGLIPSEMKRLKQLEEENSKLKNMVADLSLDRAMLQDVIKREQHLKKRNQCPITDRCKQVDQADYQLRQPPQPENPNHRFSRAA